MGDSPELARGEADCCLRIDRLRVTIDSDGRSGDLSRHASRFIRKNGSRAKGDRRYGTASARLPSVGQELAQYEQK
jgi:hypothetical protein